MTHEEKLSEMRAAAETVAADRDEREKLVRLGVDLAVARAILTRIVEQYDAKPDGPLGKGFTNRPFLDAKAFLRGTRA